MLARRRPARLEVQAALEHVSRAVVRHRHAGAVGARDARRIAVGVAVDAAGAAEGIGHGHDGAEAPHVDGCRIAPAVHQDTESVGGPGDRSRTGRRAEPARGIDETDPVRVVDLLRRPVRKRQRRDAADVIERPLDREPALSRLADHEMARVVRERPVGSIGEGDARDVAMSVVLKTRGARRRIGDRDEPSVAVGETRPEPDRVGDGDQTPTAAVGESRPIAVAIGHGGLPSVGVERHGRAVLQRSGEAAVCAAHQRGEVSGRRGIRHRAACEDEGGPVSHGQDRRAVARPPNACEVGDAPADTDRAVPPAGDQHGAREHARQAARRVVTGRRHAKRVDPGVEVRRVEGDGGPGPVEPVPRDAE